MNVPVAAPPVHLTPARIALVICSDSGLFWQGVYFLQRAAGFDPDGLMDLYYYINEPMPERYRRLLPSGVKVVHWDGALPKEDYGLASYITEATLLRIVALQELSERYDRTLYSDIDVFLRWGNLADLAALPRFDMPAAGVRDRSLWGTKPERWVARRYLPRFPAAVHNKYFNAGVLLANGPVWRDLDISARALRLLSEDPEFCHYGDQSALNAVIAGNWLELSPAWNWQANSRYDFLIPTRNPRLVHFTGPIKPWSDKWQRFDEYYGRSMHDWLAQNGLTEELEALTHRFFHASRERRRTREVIRRATDPMEMREDVKPYLDRTDFADTQAGIIGYGWHDDREG